MRMVSQGIMDKIEKSIAYQEDKFFLFNIDTQFSEIVKDSEKNYLKDIFLSTYAIFEVS